MWPWENKTILIRWKISREAGGNLLDTSPNNELFIGKHIKTVLNTTDVWFYIWGSIEETKTNRHSNAPIEGPSENPRSRSRIKTSPMHDKLRLPQVGTLASAYSHPRQRTHETATPKRLISIIKYSAPTDSEFSENVAYCSLIPSNPSDAAQTSLIKSIQTTSRIST